MTIDNLHHAVGSQHTAGDRSAVAMLNQIHGGLAAVLYMVVAANLLLAVRGRKGI